MSAVAAHRCISPAAANNESAREAAARLADKYAALARALSGSDGDAAEHLSQQLKEDLESCLAGLPPQASKATIQHEQQQQTTYPKAAAPAVRPTVSPQYSNSSSGNRSNSQQQHQQTQQPNQMLDSPESQQTQDGPVPTAAFSERNCLLPPQQAAGPQPPTQFQQQQQLQSNSHAPGNVSPTAAAGAVAGDGSAGQQQGISSMKSSYRGLTWDRKDQRWRVRVHYLGKQHHVGRFADEMEAARHFDSAAYYLFGDKAITNFGTEAAKAHNGPVPASIRALLPQNGIGGVINSTQIQQGGQMGAVAVISEAAAGMADRMQASTALNPAAAGGGAGAGMVGSSQQQRIDNMQRQQPHQFRQLSMHLVPANAVAPQPVGSTQFPQHPGPGYDSRQQQLGLQQAVNHRYQQQQQQPPRSPPHMPPPQPYLSYPLQQQQQQQQGYQPSAKLDSMYSNTSGIPDWLNKQVRLMEDLGEPAFRAARLSDGTASIHPHLHQQQQQQQSYGRHTPGDGFPSPAVSGDVKGVDPGAAVGQGQQLGPGQRLIGQAGDRSAVAAGYYQPQQQQQQQQQEEGELNMSDEELSSEIRSLQTQLCPQLQQLQQQLQDRTSSDQGLAVDQARRLGIRKYQLLKQLQQNVRELQHVFDEEDQQQQQLAAAQAAIAAGGISNVPTDELAALVGALLGLPRTKNGPTAAAAAVSAAAAGQLTGRKRSASEYRQQISSPSAPTAAAAALSDLASSSAVAASDPQAARGDSAATFSALAAVIAAIQQATGDAVTPAAVGGGQGSRFSMNAANAAAASGDEAYAAFFPSKRR